MNCAGRPFTVTWINKQELETEDRKMERFADIDLHNSPKERVNEFLAMAARGILLGMSRGAYTVTDEWNRLLPDYEFTQVEDFIKGVWGAK